FQARARAAARCSHTRLVPIHAVGQHGGRPYVVMEYLAGGRTLGEWAESEGTSPDGNAEIVRSLADALACAHEQGVVHRNLHLSDVLVGPDWIRLIGFGIPETGDGLMHGIIADIQALGVLLEQLDPRPQSWKFIYRDDLWAISRKCMAKNPARGY